MFAPAWTERLYMTWSAVAIYVVPLLVISGAYVRICAAVWASSRMHETGEIIGVGAQSTLGGETFLLEKYV